MKQGTQARLFEVWLANAREGQLVNYFERLKPYGESAALSWAKVQFDRAADP